MSSGSVVTNRAAIQFPSSCPQCGRDATTTYDVAAHRDIELFVLSYYRFIVFPVPVCRACKRGRVVAEIASVTVGVASILGGGFVVFSLLLNEWRLAAAILAAAVVALGLYVRFRADSDVTWQVLGLRIRWMPGDDMPLAISIRHSAYLRAWLAVNPDARQAADARPAGSG